MSKSFAQTEQEFIDTLHSITGRDLDQWLSMIREAGVTGHNETVKWLKSVNNFTHSSASMLAGIYGNNGRPVYASESELLDKQFEGKEDMRPLYDDIIRLLTAHFPASVITPKKTYISIYSPREFAAINIKKGELRLGLDMGDEPYDELLQKSKLSGPMPRISPMPIITEQTQLNDYCISKLKKSNERTNSK